MWLVYRLDLLVFCISIYFFCSTLLTEDCYSEECPQAIKAWIIGTFANFYLLQGLVFAMYRVKDRQIALNLFGLATVALLPLMLVFNFWGNFLIEQIETNKSVSTRTWRSRSSCFTWWRLTAQSSCTSLSAWSSEKQWSATTWPLRSTLQAFDLNSTQKDGRSTFLRKDPNLTGRTL